MNLPPPYDEVVLTVVDRARRTLSPEGAEVLEDMLLVAPGSGHAEAAVSAMRLLSQRDKDILNDVLSLMIGALAEQEAAVGEADLFE